MQSGNVYSTTSQSILTTFSDFDWATDLNTRRSIREYIVYLGINPISWQSKKQSSVSMSSIEVEYKALAHIAANIAWVRQLLKDLKLCIASTTSDTLRQQVCHIIEFQSYLSFQNKAPRYRLSFGEGNSVEGKS